ncbi:hypothetical protein [Dactylosporangium sp. NPDC000521]|uniref:hypothetical protein n=1 Tax=Dactylosporangium sp. NPDC000521 TaxID=3363975 RepID=UPI0036C82DBC
MADRTALAHLLRRATFGPTAEEVDAAERAGLSDLDNGDLKFTTDFRAVYASLLSNVLDADPQRILGYSPALLGLF